MIPSSILSFKSTNFVRISPKQAQILLKFRIESDSRIFRKGLKLLEINPSISENRKIGKNSHAVSLGISFAQV